MRLEKKATVVSTSVATLLVVIKMTVGVLSGSIAVLASAIDSFLDLTVSLFNYFALHNAEKDPDDKFHFGRGKLEPLAAVIEGVVISLSALFILYEALSKIVHQQKMTNMQDSLIVMIISIVITAGLVLFLNYVAKKTNNMVIKADALHYKTDLYTNGAILISLATIHFTDIYIIDPLLGILIAIYMIYSAYPIIKEGILMLLDVALNEEDIKKIKQVINSNNNISNFHYLQTRESGSDIFISVHLVFDMDISLYEAHKIADEIEEQIAKLFTADKKCHTLIHMDPYDDSHTHKDTDEK